MRRRKLLIGLLSAGALTAGFGAAVFPASAQLRTITVTLAGGQVVTMQVDVPPDTPVDQIPIPSVSAPTPSVPSVSTPSVPTPDPQAPSTPGGGNDGGGGNAGQAPSVDPGAPATSDPEAPTVSGPQEQQATTGGQIRKAKAKVERSKRDAEEATPFRRADGVPTPYNPTFSEALPGPAPI